MRFRAAPNDMRPNSDRRGHKAALAAALAAEVAIFSLVAPNFFTLANFFEIARLNAELGLLAVALTPILITGGIDLSVGAMMGLAAVCFGAAWRDLQWPIPAAAAVALAVGCAGGGLNALLISRLRLPALIVTLGTFSLFRGVAEGITEAAVNYSGFPPAFLALGQGYLWGVIPAQLPIFVAVLAGVFRPAASIGRRPGAVRDRFQRRRRAVRRHSGREPYRARVSVVGSRLEPRGGHLRRASRTGTVGCGKRIRARRDHGRRARRNIGVRRTRDAGWNRARARGAVGAEKRFAARGAAVRVDGDPDRRSTRIDNRDRSVEPSVARQGSLSRALQRTWYAAQSAVIWMRNSP